MYHILKTSKASIIIVPVHRVSQLISDVTFLY